jgi:16S rRNA (guanine966-N2)-methyltransferase
MSGPALQGLASRRWIGGGSLCIVEVGAREPFAPPPGYTILDERIYGAGRVIFLRFSEAD